ncbi:hypothetical protein ACLB2K_011430 [Fragaria x ananassa]
METSSSSPVGVLCHDPDLFGRRLRCNLQIWSSSWKKKTQSSKIKQMLEKKIRWFIERKVMKDFNDWLVEIRVVCRNLRRLVKLHRQGKERRI